MLTEYTPGIENYFEIDKEIVCFDNAEEMVDKITYYLEHEEERRAIARAGWERATREHTSSHMVANVFGEIERDTTARGKEAYPYPEKLKMPVLTRTILPSQYHFHWGRALLAEDYEKGLWKESLSLSLSCSPLNIAAWYCYGVGFLPASLRPALLGLYDAGAKLLGKLLSWLRSIPYLGKMLQGLVKRLV